MHWYVVQAKPRRESIAEGNLQRQCYVTYLPKIRLRKRRRDRWTNVVEPLFPCYLFIRVDTGAQSLSPVRSTVGVANLVRFGHLLRPVPDAVIDYLKARESDGTGLRTDDAWPHRPGDAVRVLAGPFAGLEGIYHERVQENRALLLLELLGRLNTVTVPMVAIA